ncbi:MAG: hypothetical protein QOF45_800, partial [Gaiellaceae bacterium]|nr:hypothetical protein [Gaiellaceae bacterium]
MATNEELRPSNRPASAGAVPMRAFRLILLAVVAALAAGAASVFPHGSAIPQQPAFLAKALGAGVAGTPERRTNAGQRVSLPRSGYQLEAGTHALTLSSAAPEGNSWHQFEQGAVRSTPFGTETVVVHRNVVEQFLTVEKRLGPKRWRWKLDTGTLKPHLRSDGSVLVSAGNLVGGFRILPAAILDGRGREISPAGTQWNLERSDGSWFLALDVDDRELALPYVIDPATIFFRAAQGASNIATDTSLVLTKPVGLALNDQMIATVLGRSNGFICPPAGWTSVLRTLNGTTLAQETFRKTAVAADVAATNFTFLLDDTAGCVSPLATLASGGIVAHYGVDNSSPTSASLGQANASSLNITAPTITPGANHVVVGIFGTRRGQTVITPPPGATPTYTERSDSSSAATANGTTLEMATGLSTGVATGAKVAVAGGTAAINIGQQISLRLDATVPTAPTLTLADTSADVHTTGTTAFYRPAGAGSFDVTAASTDAQSGIASYTFPALAGFTGSGAAATRTYTLATPTEPDGTKNVTAVDNATNVSAASTFTLTSDSTAPASVYTFPAAAGNYNATGWTGSITGTASDAGAGLATVQVAIQQGAGNYYDG